MVERRGETCQFKVKITDQYYTTITSGVSTKVGTLPGGSSIKLQASSAKLFKLQATSFKPHAQRIKLQAARSKVLDHGSLIKFYDARTEGLDADEAIVRMGHVIGNLMG